MRIRSTGQAAGWLWATAEMLLLCVGLLVVLYLNRNEVPERISGQGVLFVSVVTALWGALRVPDASMGRGWRLALGPARAFLAGTLVAGAAMLFFSGFRWRPALTIPLLGEIRAGLVIFVCGPVSAAFASGIMLARFWNRLRRRHFHLAITHAFVLMMTVFISGYAAYFTVQALRSKPAGRFVADTAAANFIAKTLTTVFPSLSVLAIILVAFCLVSLPTLGMFSYLISRRTTRRIRTLAEASEFLRRGNYAVRVEASGEDEVAQLQKNFNAMAVDLSRTLRELQAERRRVSGLLEARRRWTANVSHELRAPLATLRAHLESMPAAAGARRKEAARNVGVILREIDRLNSLLDDLLDLSRKEAGGLRLHLAPVRAEAVAARVVESLRPFASQSGLVALTADFPPGLAAVSADERRLEQILVNLVRNGIGHTPPGGIVSLSADDVGGFVLVHVRDTGEGIEPEELPRVWEPFFRSREGTSARFPGEGLGLVLVKELAEAMGGTAGATSVPGRGSDFFIRFRKA